MPVGSHEHPAADPAGIDGVLADIAADYRQRLAGGGTQPPLRGLKLVRDQRWGAVRLAREHGGAGYSVAQFFDHLIALAAADPDLAHILRIHYALVEELQVEPRPPGSDRWIAVVAEGGLIGGANAEKSQMSVGGNDRDSRLVSTGDGLRLRGRKFYSTGAQFSDYLRITAQDDDNTPTAVVIPVDRAGVEHLDDWDGIGQRQTGSGTTVFHDVVVEPDEVFPMADTIGVNRARGALMQLYLHAIAAGILRALTEDAAPLVRGRGRTYTFASVEEPTADPQLLQIVGEIDAVAYAAQALVHSAAAELAPLALDGPIDVATRASLLGEIAKVDHANAVMVYEAKALIAELGPLLRDLPRQEIDRQVVQMLAVERKLRGSCVLDLKLPDEERRS